MAKLYFHYSAMNAGKSTALLQVAHNYEEQQQHVYVLTAKRDDRYGVGKVTSRLGVDRSVDVFADTTDLLQALTAQAKDEKLAAVLIDEAHWLSAAQVWQLAAFVDEGRVPVLCYGLRTDFQGELFSGAETLLAIADELREIKNICHCGRKATMNLRVDAQGRAVTSGPQTMVGGNESYQALCRAHWREARASVGT